MQCDQTCLVFRSLEKQELGLRSFRLKKALNLQFFAVCNLEMATFVQFFLCSNLFSKLEKTCIKVGI